MKKIYCHLQHRASCLALLFGVVLLSVTSVAPCLAESAMQSGLFISLSGIDTSKNISAGDRQPEFVFDVEMVLDDGTAETIIGTGGFKEFLFLNRFTPESHLFPFELKEIHVFFDSSGFVTIGDSIHLVVYENTSGNTNPATGSNWLASFPVTIQNPGSWNVYNISSTPVTLDGPGDVLIGVIAMEKPGTSYAPASLDQTTSQFRSWMGYWNASPPSPPLLPPDEEWLLTDTLFPGNWLVRGYGDPSAPPTPVPTNTPTEDCIHHGDVNLDGIITAADAQLAFFIVLGTYSPTYEEECAADCNDDGSVTAADAQAIFLTVLGQGTCVDPL